MIRTHVISITLIGTLFYSTAATAIGYPNVPMQQLNILPVNIGEIVKLGEDIINITNTHPLTKDYVGNKLQCKSCHLQGGKKKALGTFYRTARSFPAYSKREKTIQTLQDRINNCFIRSMNGVRPIIDIKASVAVTG